VDVEGQRLWRLEEEEFMSGKLGQVYTGENAETLFRPEEVGGLEWYPLLAAGESVTKAGHDHLWVCGKRLCGMAFKDHRFLRAHQQAKGHGKWDGDTPVASNGEMTAKLIDCRYSGDVDFSSDCVERDQRKVVANRSEPDERRIEIDAPLPGKVLHTGDRGKGWAYFAAKSIKAGDYVGRYSGTVRNVGTALKYTGHYCFATVNGFVVDGTLGGGLRFMNHCLENEIPGTRALITAHKGIASVAIYAARNLEPGEEITLRYQDIPDKEFFASLCGEVAQGVAGAKSAM